MIGPWSGVLNPELDLVHGTLLCDVGRPDVHYSCCILQALFRHSTSCLGSCLLRSHQRHFSRGVVTLMPLSDSLNLNVIFLWDDRFASLGLCSDRLMSVTCETIVKLFFWLATGSPNPWNQPPGTQCLSVQLYSPPKNTPICLPFILPSSFALTIRPYLFIS